MLAGAVLFVAALLGSALNAVAGGGSFLTFPALMFSGVSPVIANATSTVALWPASLASAWAYRRETQARSADLIALAASSVVGGLLGALLLLYTPEAAFAALVPGLLLAATLLFTFGPAVRARLEQRNAARRSGQASAARRGSRRALLAGVAVLQLGVSVYGGYFGAGGSIVILAVLSLLPPREQGDAAQGAADIHTLNGMKTVLGVLINCTAVIAFAAARKVDWSVAPLMIAGGLLGGYAGAAWARRVAPARVRRLVLVVAWGMTAYFAVQALRR